MRASAIVQRHGTERQARETKPNVGHAARAKEIAARAEAPCIMHACTLLLLLLVLPLQSWCCTHQLRPPRRGFRPDDPSFGRLKVHHRCAVRCCSSTGPPSQGVINTGNHSKLRRTGQVATRTNAG